ncbi:MAG: ABC transporter permease [Pirellulales bacterium]|nr:ABC transporter permease [Pirellulales bacterium]
MYRALWSKSFRDGAVMLVALTVLMFTFNVLFVWMSSHIKVAIELEDVSGVVQVALESILKGTFSNFEKLSGVPFEDVARREGLLALAYVDPVVLFSFVIWGIGRGSDTVSGPLGRGTLEMIVAQPVSRAAILFPQIVIATLGCAVLAVAVWLGTCLGIAIVPLEKVVDPMMFVPAAANLFGLGFFLAGFTTLVSSLDTYRARTIGIAAGFFIVQLMVKIVARMADGFEWLLNFTFLGAFEPQVLVRDWQTSGPVLAYYNGVLVGLGTLAFVAATVIFSRRDLPAPL